jgi:hypothetical protein
MWAGDAVMIDMDKRQKPFHEQLFVLLDDGPHDTDEARVAVSTIRLTKRMTVPAAPGRRNCMPWMFTQTMFSAGSDWRRR